jgi:hypothetical protein
VTTAPGDEPEVLELGLPEHLPLGAVVCDPARPARRYRCWHNPSAWRNPTVWSPCSPSGEIETGSYGWWHGLFVQFGGMVSVVSVPASLDVPAGAILQWRVPHEPPPGSTVAYHRGRPDLYQRRPSPLDGEMLWHPQAGGFPRTWLELLEFGPVSVLSRPG